MSKTTIQMQRRGDRLECTSPVWADILLTIPERVELNVAVSRARSVRQNGTYWGLLSWVVDNGPEWIAADLFDKDGLSDALQLEAGFVNVRKIGDDVHRIPKSKNFEECSQETFNRYFEAALLQLTKWCGYEPLPLYLDYMAERGRKRAA